MWCDFYIPDMADMVIRSTNGLERQNEVFKYQYLQGMANSTLHELMTKLLTYLKESYNK